MKFKAGNWYSYNKKSYYLRCIEDSDDKQLRFRYDKYINLSDKSTGDNKSSTVGYSNMDNDTPILYEDIVKVLGEKHSFVKELIPLEKLLITIL